VLGVPRIYARFRPQAAKEGRLFRPEMSTQSSAIASDEVDVLILVMLRNARKLLTYNNSQKLLNSTNHEWLESIKSRYLMQVFVDEATDFSAVQLSCMLELAHPSLRSWFACGDLQQRITANGLEDVSELQWLRSGSNAPIDIEEVAIGYRQTHRLREFTAGLFALENGREVALEAPRGFEAIDVRPIIGEHLSGPSLCAWLANRIVEVEQSVGHLPSVALFVDSDESIDPLVRELSPLLARHNIRVVGCKEGRIVGDALEVRVFDVQHIKGLEFEAVFLLAIDRLASKLPDLFHRFIYVGATRAATYLALTSEGPSPDYLEKIRPCFQTGGWRE
jgi:DNA helicase IV